MSRFSSLFRLHAKLALIIGAAGIFLAASITASLAQTRTFNYPKWAGAIVDNCVTYATNCNGGGANNFCRLKGYSRASNWRIYRPGRTYVIGSRRYCTGGGCGGYRAITCTGSRGGGGGGSNAACDSYARTAISQQRQNLNRRCGYTGGRWQLNYNNHYNWCRRAGVGARNSETNQRRAGLNRCRGGSSSNTACDSYARTAISQQRQNLNRRCGYTGGRWQLNYNNHYNWCRRAGVGARNSETNQRRSGLNRCRGGGGASRTFSYPKWNGAIVDNCVTWATNCNGGGANNFCRLKGYSRASNWRIYRPGRTYVIGSRRFCDGGGCGGYSSVTCVRGGGG